MRTCAGGMDVMLIGGFTSESFRTAFCGMMWNPVWHDGIRQTREWWVTSSFHYYGTSPLLTPPTRNSRRPSVREPEIPATLAPHKRMKNCAKKSHIGSSPNAAIDLTPRSISSISNRETSASANHTNRKNSKSRVISFI